MSADLQSYNRQLAQSKQKLVLSIVLLLISSLGALFIGRYPVAGFASPQLLLSDPLYAQVVLHIRLPRVVLAVAGGAALAAAGYVFQMLFANPLVEPGFLGVSQGAAFGAASAMVFFGSSAALIQVFAAVGGLVALFLSYLIARLLRFGGSILRLVLAGIAVGAFFSALLSLVKLAADPHGSLQEITFWMMGGLYNSNWSMAVWVVPIIGVSLTLLLLFRWRINILSLSAKSAHAVGLAVGVQKGLLLLCATTATTAIISVAGLLGWVGLIIPHLGRKLYGSDARYSLGGSALLGALFLLLCDTAGRTLLSSEIPLGVITSLCGAALFVVILSQKEKEREFEHSL